MQKEFVGCQSRARHSVYEMTQVCRRSTRYKKEVQELAEPLFCYNENMPRVIDTTNPNYIAYCKNFHPNGSGAHNGAYYYSQEIVKNIIPNVNTWRPWDTLGMKFLKSYEHAIVFIHHNLSWDKVYSWLDRYEDQILVCSTRPTYEWALSHGKKAILLPLSIDVDYVKQFQTKKTKRACYAGNRWAFKREDEQKNIPKYVDFPPPNLPREELLKFIAPYKECYAIGRCAIEALCLGCKIKPFYRAYPDSKYWKVLSNQKTAEILQKHLDRIDHQ